jgi:branched-chain amino acid transport system permease protein
VILAMLMFGGIGVIAGAVAGAVVLGALPEIFRFISDYRLLTFGAILVLMLRFQPQGLLGEGSVLVRAGRRILPLAGRGTRRGNAATGGPDGPA